MSDIRCLYRAGYDPAPLANGAPSGPSKDERDARKELAEFLDHKLMQPLWPKHARNQVEDALKTMTQAERVNIEIELQARNRATHSYEYDSLK